MGDQCENIGHQCEALESVWGRRKTDQIKDNAVTSAKIAENTITAADIEADAVETAEIKGKAEPVFEQIGEKATEIKEEYACVIYSSETQA